MLPLKDTVKLDESRFLRPGVYSNREGVEFSVKYRSHDVLEAIDPRSGLIRTWLADGRYLDNWGHADDLVSEGLSNAAS